jgi:tetratricopeptide (TPR) repeat protein
VTDQPAFHDAVRAARELLDAGQYAGVVAVCCQQLELGQEEGALLLLRARAWIALGQPAQAIDDLREVLRLDPQCGAAYRALGRLLMSSGDLAAARAAFVGALSQGAGDDREARAQLAAVDAALAMEAALSAEAAELEEALAAALDGAEEDDPEDDVRSDGVPRLARSASPWLQRLPTQPMGRASTSAAGWRAPTMPLELSGHAVRPLARHAGGSLRRAPTQPMERAASTTAPWRAPTLPVVRGVGHRRATTAPFHRRAPTLDDGEPFGVRAVTSPLPRSED